jgi:hypothetical protein
MDKNALQHQTHWLFSPMLISSCESFVGSNPNFFYLHFDVIMLKPETLCMDDNALQCKTRCFFSFADIIL